MPNINVTLPDTIQAISRPVVVAVADELKRATGIPEDIYTVYVGDIEAAYQYGSSIDQNSRDPILKTDDKFIIESKENFNEDSLATTQVSQPQQIPIFADRELGVYVKPIYATVDVELTLKYQSRSKTAVKRWRDGIRTRLSQTFDTFLHTATYHYMLPTEILDLLQAIYQARETVAGYGDTFYQYVAENGTNRFTSLTTLTGKDSSIAVAEKQGKIIGIMDIAGVLEEPEKEEDGNLWTINISYRFSYQRPMGCDASYPIMIHNQLLPEKFVKPNNDDITNYRNPTSANFTVNALQKFQADQQIYRYLQRNPIIRIPKWDDFIPESVANSSVAIFYALVQLEEGSNSVASLNDLGDIQLDPDILDFLTIEYPYLTKMYYSFLYLELYESMTPLTSDYLSIDSNMNVTSVQPLNMRKNYRLRLSVMTDLTLIDQGAFDRIKKYPKAFVKIILSINEALVNFPGFLNLGDKAQITEYDFISIFTFLTGTNFVGKGIAPNNKRMAPLSYLSQQAWDRFKWERVQPQRQMHSYVVVAENAK